MANKNTKNKDIMDKYAKRDKRNTTMGRVMAIVMIFLMLAFTFLTAGMFLAD